MERVLGRRAQRRAIARGVRAVIPTASRGQALVVANGAETAHEFADYEAVSGARRRRSCGGGGNHGAESRVEVIVVEREVGDGVEVGVHLGKKVSVHWEKRRLDYGVWTELRVREGIE
jgi:hypothetical protein